MSKNNENPSSNDGCYTVAEVMNMLGIDGYPQCKLSDFLGSIMEQAKAWQLLEHLIDETAPSLSSASNRIGAEIEACRRQGAIDKTNELIKLIAKNKEVCMFGSQQDQYDADEPRYKFELIGPERLVKTFMDVLVDATDGED